MPVFKIKMIVDDDALDDACTMTVDTTKKTVDRAEGQRNALKFANKLSMKAAPGKRFIMRLHDDEWEKTGTMSRPEMRKYINELAEEFGFKPGVTA